MAADYLFIFSITFLLVAGCLYFWETIKRAKRDETIFLLVDIGSGGLGTALVFAETGKLPKIVFSKRVPFTGDSKLNPGALPEGMATLLNDLLNKTIVAGFAADVLMDKQKEIASVIVSFSSPWFSSEMKHIVLSQETPFIITPAFLNDVAEKQTELFKAELTKESKAEQTDTYAVVEKSIVHTKVNGYTLENILGERTKTLDAYICLSIIKTSVADKVADIILKHTHIVKEKILMHTFPLLSFSVIRDIFPQSHDFVVFDIAGDTTSITVATASKIDKTRSFQYGRNNLIRSVASGLQSSPEIIESALKLFNSGKSDNQVAQKLETELTAGEKDWSVAFEQAFLELFHESVQPRKIYIVCDSITAPIFEKYIKFPKNNFTAEFKKNAEVQIINPTALSAFYKNEFVAEPEERLALLTVFAGSLFKK